MIIPSPKNIQDAEKKKVPASSFLKLKHPGINFKPSYKDHRNNGSTFQAKQIAPSLICIIGIFVQFLNEDSAGGTHHGLPDFPAIFRNLRWINSMGILNQLVN